PELPYLPQLPNRGFGADLIAQACAVLVDLPVDYQPHGWTLASHPGRDMSRARDHLLRDLDALTEQAQGLPLLKVQLAGPLTLAGRMPGTELVLQLDEPAVSSVLAGQVPTPSGYGTVRSLPEPVAEAALAGVLAAAP